MTNRIKLAIYIIGVNAIASGVMALVDVVRKNREKKMEEKIDEYCRLKELGLEKAVIYDLKWEG